jgi:DNA-binding NtrC family response regulator
MNINFLTNLITIRQNKSETRSMPSLLPTTPRPLIVKLDAHHYRLDTYHEQLVADGFQVVRGTSIKEGIKLIRRVKPDLIVVIDNPGAGLGGSEWLSNQHSDLDGVSAMIPLIIVAERQRVPTLKVHELPGRVKIVQSPLQLDTLITSIRDMLMLSDF